MIVFGAHPDGPVHQATLASDVAEVDILSYGAILRDWRVKTPTGWRTVTLGFDTFEPYLANPRSFGIVAGRVVNRIRGARFTLDGVEHRLEENRPPHHIHGGSNGIGKRLWTMEATSKGVRLTIDSEDGDMGYPGHARITVDFRLDGAALTFDMTGEVDRPGPISLAQHSYYNLSGAQTVEDHVFQVPASRRTALDDAFVATGALVDVAPYDARTPRRVGTQPLDLNYCLDPRPADEPAGRVSAGGLALTLHTDQPGLQVYNAFNMTDVGAPGLGGRHYGAFAGLALEAQHWPNAVHHPHFPSVIARPGAPYRQTTTVTIAPEL